MDFATLFGILIGMGLVGGAIVMQGISTGTDPLLFIDPVSFMIVIGGTMAATSVSFPLKEVMRVMTILRAVFKGGSTDLSSLVDEIVDIASVARKGPKELENAIGQAKNYFFRDGVQMVVDGYAVEEIRSILQTRVEYREERERAEAGLFKAMGRFAPAFGMIGTLIGLVFMLKGMAAGASEDMAANLGSGMAVALLTTFWGALMANLFFLPMAEKLASQISSKSTEQNLVTEGVCLLAQKKHPLIVREKINSFIPPREWKRMD
ncbi:MAG: MotA/TolQ/ExbB proton channel family protein [Candidatus Neomarinimicrobiota bacterium]